MKSKFCLIKSRGLTSSIQFRFQIWKHITFQWVIMFRNFGNFGRKVTRSVVVCLHDCIHYDMSLQSLRTWTVTGRPTISYAYSCMHKFTTVAVSTVSETSNDSVTEHLVILWVECWILGWWSENFRNCQYTNERPQIWWSQFISDK